MATYECLRRLLPSVYSSTHKRRFRQGVMDNSEDLSEHLTQNLNEDSARLPFPRNNSLGSIDRSLPDVISFNWVSSVFSVSWNTVRRYSGLDGYFFLRFIRMNLRICAVTSFWAFVILVPTYATGVQNEDQGGWYHFSVRLHLNVIASGCCVVSFSQIPFLS